MKTVAIQAFGGPEGLVITDVPTPVPGEGQVRIACEAIAVGFQDAMIRRGALASYGFAKGHVLGGEIAGTVVALGPGVDASLLGRRVWAFTTAGYAEYALASADQLVPLPPEISPTDAVAIGGAGAVAHFALRHARFAPGESVLVRGAAGPIGIMAVQIAARDGAAAIAVTTSMPERGERLRALGATHVRDRAGTGTESFDVILDIVAGPDMASFLGKLRPNGRMVAVGAVGGFPPAFGEELFRHFQRSLSFATFSAATVPEPARRAVTAELLASGMKAIVHEVLPLADARTAHERMEAGGAFGRIVLTGR